MRLELYDEVEIVEGIGRHEAWENFEDEREEREEVEVRGSVRFEIRNGDTRSRA